jgi:hypothetical protein
MRALLSVLALHAFFSAGPLGFADSGFQSCAEMLKGTSCRDLDPTTPIAALCCGGNSARSKQNPSNKSSGPSLSDLQTSIHNSRIGLFSCYQKNVPAAKAATPCEQKGCFCGVDDSRLPASCFGGLQTCCNTKQSSDIPNDLRTAQALAGNLASQLKDCNAACRWSTASASPCGYPSAGNPDARETRTPSRGQAQPAH